MFDRRSSRNSPQTGVYSTAATGREDPRAQRTVSAESRVGRCGWGPVGGTLPSIADARQAVREGCPGKVITVVNWRERLHLSSAKDARDEVLRALPDVITDLTPIAVVRNDITDTGGRTWAQEASELVFRDEFVPALDGLDGFTHVFVLTWLDQVSDAGRALLRIHPSGDESSPEVGVFATRTAHRPNPIAVSIVPLEWVRGNIVRVIGLDVASGTPVLDVKPYVSFYDSFKAEIPSWAE